MILNEFLTYNVFQIAEIEHNHIVKYHVEAHNLHGICKMHLAMAQLVHPRFGNYNKVKTIMEKAPQKGHKQNIIGKHYLQQTKQK